MSDPVANVEIEDVLSSIRRLVSAEERGDATKEERAESQEAEETKLLLTPAQRVDDAAPRDEGEEDDYDAWAEAEPSRADTGQDPYDDIEDAEIVAPDAKGDAPETDSLDADMPRFVHHHAPDEEGAQEAPGAEEDFAAEAEDASAPEAFAARDTLAEDMADPAGEEGRDMAGEDEGAEVDLKALEARIAGFETAVAQQDEEWEPDGTPDDTYAGHPVSPLPWRDSDEAAEAAETPDDAPGQGAPPDVEAAPKDTAEAGQWDMAEDRSYDRPEAAAGDDEDDAESWYAEDTIIDEEALRDMVSEIVRQELQGALGERITRNVRKLVRREIHRALMSQKME